jgi:hypothetical protein
MAGNLKNAERNNIILAKTNINSFAPTQNLKKLISGYEEINVINRSGVRGAKEETDILVYGLNNCTLQFPDDFPEDVFLIADYTHYEPWSGFVVVDLVFFGNYSFDWGQRTIIDNINQEGERTTYGLPLSGKSVEVPIMTSKIYYNETGAQQVVVNPRISFYKKTDYHNTISATYNSQYRYAGFFNGDASPFEYEFKTVEKKNTTDTYDNIIGTYLLDNLPDMSFLELYNALAFLQNKIVVKNGDTLTMRGYDDYNIVELHNIISVDSSERVGLVDAKKMIVKFADTPIAREGERIIDEYYTDSEILKDEQVLLTLPFYEGQTLQGFLYQNDIIDKTKEKDATLPAWTYYEYQGDKFTIAKNNGEEFLEQAPNPYNDILERIAQQSTRINVSVYMSLHEYNQITETTRINCQGTMCVWTSSNWSDNKAKFTLQKI